MDYNALKNNVSAVLSQQLFTEISKLNLGIDTATLNKVVATTANVQSGLIVTDAFLEGNKQFAVIPTQYTGPYDPLNIVTENQSSADIFDNLSNIVNTALTGTVLGRTLETFRTELGKYYPSTSPVIQNYEAAALQLPTVLQNSVTGAIEAAFKGYTDSIFENTTTIPPILEDAKSVFDSLFKIVGDKPLVEITDDLIDEYLDKIDQQFSETIVNDTLDDVQNFNIENDENNAKLDVVKKGFQDPTATYPTKEYAGESEVNKLARGEVKGTVVPKKEKERVKGAALPFGQSFDEPSPAYNGEYPYNKVTQTESGHVLELDDTPGNERMHLYHKSGTYIEIDSNGSVVKRTKGSSYEIIDKNGKIAILGKADVSIKGECNIYVGNDTNIEVLGNVNMKCHNDVTVEAGRKINLAAKEEFNIHSKNVYIEADEDLHIQVDKKAYFHTGEDMHILSNKAAFISAKTNLNTVSEQSTLMKTGTKFEISATGDIDIVGDGIKQGANGNFDIVAEGDFNLDSATSYINSGAATSPTVVNATAASKAQSSKIGLLDASFIKKADKVNIADPEPIRYGARQAEKSEGVVPSSEQEKKTKDDYVASGNQAPKSEQNKPVENESSSPKSKQDKVIMPDEKLLKATELPGNYKLSPNFTLDNSWRTVAVCPGKHVLRAQRNLTYGQICYNLQALALNVVEPLKALYPKVLITSCFRHDTEYPVSPHAVGMALDCQFPGATTEEYYDIAVKLAENLKFDQILLEYWSQAASKRPWIHIGLGNSGQFDPKGLRMLTWTFSEHKLYARKFVKLTL